MRELSLLLSLTDCGKRLVANVVDLGVSSTRKKGKGIDFGVVQAWIQILVVPLFSGSSWADLHP